MGEDMVERSLRTGQRHEHSSDVRRFCDKVPGFFIAAEFDLMSRFLFITTFHLYLINALLLVRRGSRRSP